MRMWSGDQQETLAGEFDRLNRSLPVDQRLMKQDIAGSQAWAGALLRAGVISQSEHGLITNGLDQVRAIFEADDFQPLASDEDIHTAVERLLFEQIGELAGKLHTGRSRNDQVATDFRLWLLDACQQLIEGINQLAKAIVAKAESGRDLPMPGYTHLRQAQVVTWDHWLLSHFWPLLRDRQRIRRAMKSASVLPLGSGALAGTSIKLVRQQVAEDLGFSSVSSNSLDAVSDRDFAAEFLFAASLLGVHFSRLAEMLILFSSSEFGFVSIDEKYASGSSLMPQKQNPDGLELARGKSARLHGNLTSLLMTLKGLPSAYDKDLQEDKAPVFDSFDTLILLLPVMTGIIETLHLHPKQMRASIQVEMLATDLADYLVGNGVPFRRAHQLVGQAVAAAAKLEVSLSELPFESYREISKKFEEDLFEVFSIERSLEQRRAVGGTASEARQAQLAAAKEALAEL